MKTLHEVLLFWFNENIKDMWFSKDDNFDKDVKNKFLSLYENEIKKDNILTNAKEGLARIILFDQFPRNMFRDSPKSFQSDCKAKKIAYELIKLNLINLLNNDEKQFAFMPFMHSENLDDQKLSVSLFKELGNKKSLEFAIAHMEIIKKYGRFPHRNNILSRKSTQEEREFLLEPNSSF